MAEVTRDSLILGISNSALAASKAIASPFLEREDSRYLMKFYKPFNYKFTFKVDCCSISPDLVISPINLIN